jgi:hypothetical protein
MGRKSLYSTNTAIKSALHRLTLIQLFGTLNHADNLGKFNIKAGVWYP